MMNSTCIVIKKNLENKFDIPFRVEERREYNDSVFKIAPEYEMEELFEVKLVFRQNIRLIIEIQPQKYAAEMLNVIQQINEEKRILFLNYIELFKNKGFKVDVFINQQIQEMSDQTVWQTSWKKFRIRATGILSADLDENVLMATIFEWSSLAVGMVLALLNIETLEDDELQYKEGRVHQILTNRYERNPANRELCLAANGYKCKICGFDFEIVYGELGHHFIHVHHIEKVASFGGEYYLDPAKELIPVCPNCHAMLHRTDPPIKPVELKNLIEQIKGNEEITDE